MTDKARSRGDDSQQPALDANRRRLVLPRSLVPASLLLLDSFVPDLGAVTGLRALEAAGIARNGRLHALARAILQPLAAPSAVLSVETSRNMEVSIATIWTGRKGASIGSSTDGSMFVLEPIEPDLIPFHIAALTELSIRPMPSRRPLRLERDESGHRAPRGPCPNAADAGCPVTCDSCVAGTLVGSGSRRWRVTTLWSEPDGFVGDSSLEIIDGADLGYWEVTDPAGRGATVLTPRSVDDVLRLLADAARPG